MASHSTQVHTKPAIRRGSTDRNTSYFYLPQVLITPLILLLIFFAPQKTFAQNHALNQNQESTLPWDSFQQYDNTLTSEQLTRLLNDVYATDSAWRKYLKISTDGSQASLLNNNSILVSKIKLNTSSEQTTPPPRYWRNKQEILSKTKDNSINRPLQGIRIAIDPGHLGGAWAKSEARWFQLNDDIPVTEGDMTLQTAFSLKKKLESLGAEITLVRNTTDPVTALRPSDYLEEASKKHSDSKLIQETANRLFFRRAEIAARADLINNEIKPDLTICLHFNANAWDDPESPTLVPKSHFHLLITGATMTNEWDDEHQRFSILHKLFQQCHTEELAIAKATVPQFQRRNQLRGFFYKNSPLKRANALDDKNFIWARNLAALRRYQCPVLFCEPYVMNSLENYDHIQAGNYPGLKNIQGKQRLSIYEEYATAVTAGVLTHYQKP